MTSTAWIDEIAWPAVGPPWLAMGLSRVDDRSWLLPDDHRDAERAERTRLLDDRHGEVFAALAGTEPAGAEVLGLVQAWEARHRPDLADVPVDPSVHPLEAAGRRTQEDLVVMVPRDGSYHLDAAVLCFPSHWRLADKLGGSAAAIHGPVPRYAEELEQRVDRFFDRLRPGVIVARRNWSVHGDDALFAPVAPLEPTPVAPEQVGSALWLRSERQTLRRLPRTGAIAFTIKVQQAPFAAFADHPGAAQALASRIEAQPDELTEMNGLAPHRDRVIHWLRTNAEGGSTPAGDQPPGGHSTRT